MKKEEKIEEVEVPVVETPVVETKKPTRVEPSVQEIDGWEIKQRTYVLKNGKRPLSYSIRARGMYYFDEEKGYEREIQLTRNQNTVFVDEFKGDVRPARIVFRNGYISVPKEQVIMQKMLSLYHPSKDKLYVELQPKAQAASELTNINIELDAMIAAREMDIDMVEAIMRTEIGSRVTEMTSKELKRDVLVFAKNNPKLFLNLMSDENIHLRNLGIKACEQHIIQLSGDQRTFTWGSTGRKLLNVPFEEHPYSALAAWFKTDEGMEVLKSVEKQLR
jgi:hypothetical protein|tara:strand:+ start:890 stop:1717 length:828 start_codon:yes stop_codon:yes gene_type:complete